MAGLDGDGGKYHVELTRNGKSVRIGPYKEPGKAKLRQRLEEADWTAGGSKGKRPELIYTPLNQKPDPTLTAPTHRQSPRTGNISSRRTVGGENLPSGASGYGGT